MDFFSVDSCTNFVWATCGSRFFVRVKSWCDVIKILLHVLSLKVSFDSFVFWLLIKFVSNSMYIFSVYFSKILNVSGIWSLFLNVRKIFCRRKNCRCVAALSPHMYKRMYCRWLVNCLYVCVGVCVCVCVCVRACVCVCVCVY